MIDSSARKSTAGTEIGRFATGKSTTKRSNAMNNVLAQRPWKETLAVGVLTAVLGGMVLGPGPSILISVTLFDVCLLGLV
jgi:hypothetical protein